MQIINQDETDVYTRAMFGIYAKHVPVNIIIQNTGHANIVSLVGVSVYPAGLNPLRYDSNRTHQLILGDAVIRPRLVAASDNFRGYGLAGLVTSNATTEVEAWIEKNKGEILIKNF